MTHRFLLFSGPSYHPSGGWDDFIGAYETLEAAIERSKKMSEWWHIVDLNTMKTIHDKS